MKSSISIFTLGGIAIQSMWLFPSGNYAQQRIVNTPSQGLESFITTEKGVAMQRLLCNVGTSGCVNGADQGVVVASPDKEDPNYFYTWSRDAALVVKYLVDDLISNYSLPVQTIIQEYVNAQAIIQGIDNPSGTFSSGEGLGEPKFHVDMTAFEEPWGRPQRDGPALRAITLIAYSKWLIDNDYNATAKNVLWPIIRNDLSYVGQFWNETGFDLWEEIDGSSYFTIAAQYRSLIEGTSLAELLDETCDECTSQAPHIFCFLQNFWDPTNNYMIANINDKASRSGIDVNTILASIHNFDGEADCDNLTFQPCSERALANHKAVTDSFRDIYTLNKGKRLGQAIAIGRYKEDIYYGGNPWYLATSAAAEQLYDTLYTWDRQGFITVTMVSLPFFQDFEPSLRPGNYAAGSIVYNRLYNAVQRYADGFLNIVASYTQANGSLSEQFGKEDGHPLSAYDLTWSYAAFLTAVARRDAVVPKSWVPSTLEEIPSICQRSSAQGTYVLPSTTSWPASQPPRVPNHSSSSPNPPGQTCTPVNTVNVSFREKVETDFGESIKIVGSSPELGEWNIDQALPLSADTYTAKSPLWMISVLLEAGSTVEYKFIKVMTDGSVQWEAGPNHILSVPAGCRKSATVTASWQE